MRLVSFEGKQFSFPDDATDDEVAEALETQQPKTLFSAEGIASTLRMVGPSIARGILGSQLMGLEEINQARKNARSTNPTLPVTPDELETERIINEKRLAIQEADKHLAQLRGNPSGPLEVAQNVVTSVAGNAPGVATAVLTRNTGAVGAIPALDMADKLQSGQTYATDRGVAEPKASVADSQTNAYMQGKIEAAFEFLPTSYIMKNLGTAGLGQFVREYFLRELGTEIPTTVAQNISDWATTQKDMPLNEFLAKAKSDVIDTALMVPFSAGATGLGAKSIAALGKLEDRPLDIPLVRSLDLRNNVEDNAQLPSTETPAPVIPPVAPAPDLPTTDLPGDQKEQIQSLIDSLDAELITDEEVTQGQATVAKFLEQQKAPKTEANAVAWMPLQVAPKAIDDIDTEMGATQKQANNAKNYPNPNDKIDRLERTFLMSTVEGVAGKTPMQVAPQPGTHVLGAPTNDRSEEFLRAAMETLEEKRQKWMPNAVFVISNEGLPNSIALGTYHNMGPGMHLIVPAVLRNPSQGLTKFNPNTQAGAFYNLFHEFTHGLVEDEFFLGVDPKAALAAREASKLNVVPAELIASFPPVQQAVIREFNAIKSRILSNDMSAKEFIEAWFGPAKLGRDYLGELKVAPTDNAMAVVQALARKAAKKKNINDGTRVKQMLNMALENFLSLDEYLAEQGVRHAYATKQDESTALGKFFGPVLKKLRAFFLDLKGEGWIKPGTAFTDWIEGLGSVNRTIDEGSQVAEGKKKGRAPAKKSVKKTIQEFVDISNEFNARKKQLAKLSPEQVTEEIEKVAKSKSKVKVKKVQHNVETDTAELRVKKARQMVTGLVKDRTIEANSEDQKELLRLIREEDWDGFRDEMQKWTGKKVKFEFDDLPWEERYVAKLKKWLSENNIDVLKSGIEETNNPSIIADAQGEWKRNQFRSKYFKAWFGDWENDLLGSSKIRRGAFKLEPDPKRPWDLPLIEASPETAAEPLVVFHATSKDFTAFEKGDIGFHFGTATAAHERIFYPAPDGSMLKTPTDNLFERQVIIPAVLNIRNPLRLDDLGGWTPRYLVEYLGQIKILTPDEKSQILQRMSETPAELWGNYEASAPLREVLVRKGYDGIVYVNGVEDRGSLSFIAFHANQVKSLLGSRTFSRSDNLHMELDLDASQESNIGARKLWDGLKNFVSDFPRLRRATRFVLNAQYHMLELQQLAHIHPDVEDLSFMTEVNRNYNRYKSRLQASADAVATKWEKLNKEQFSKLNKFLLKEAEGSELWYGLKKTVIQREGKPTPWYVYEANEVTVQKVQEFGLEEETLALALEVKNTLLSQLNEAELALQAMLGARFAAAGADVLLAAVKPVKRHIHQLRKQPFYPEGRFGNRMLIIEKQKADGRGYEVIWREAFEDATQWEEAWKKAVARRAPDERVRKETLSDQSYVLMSLPTDFVDLAASELGLSDAQLEILMNLLQPVKRDRVLGAYDQQRLGIKGYSSDAYRAFANFTWHNSNMLAKLIYRGQFNSAIRSVHSKVREQKYLETPESIAEVEKLEHIERFMMKVRDYVMSPPNEAQTLRAAVSLTYLGLNVKTAVLNVVGLMTTWSDVTSRLGQVEGNKVFVQSMLKAARSIKLRNLNEARPGDYLDPELQQAFERALEEGVLSQSYAYHLAGVANAGNLQRLGAYRITNKGVKTGLDLAMYVFRLTELATRRASFIAEYEIARKEKLPFTKTAYDVAVERTNKLQNEYSLGNRVPFMRGVKASNENPVGKFFEPAVPLATVFMSFVQHMAFHAYGGYELGERRAAKLLGETPRAVRGGYTMKLWIVLLLLAGYEGLPGAENLIDLLELAWRKFGGEKPVRQEIREMVQGIEGLDPQLAARGLGHNFFGFDISRSVGLGRIVPGTDTLNRPGDNGTELFGNLVLDLLGPTGGLIKYGFESIASTNGYRKATSMLPGGVGNILTAYKWSEEGVRAPSGAIVTHDLETGELRDLTAGEIAGKALGFNPTVVSQNKEIRFNQYDRKIYWETRRKMLMDDYWEATWRKDPEALADAKRSVSEFNMGVPAEYRALRLTGADLAKSMQTRRRQVRVEEAQSTTSRKYRQVYEDVKRSYDQP